MTTRTTLTAVAAALGVAAMPAASASAANPVSGTTSPQSADSTLTATVGPYLALSGGSADFGTIVPRILASSFTGQGSLSVSTSSPTGVSVSVAPSTAVTNMGITGASVFAQNTSSVFAPLNASGVPVVSASVPVNQAYTIPFLLDLLAGTVLRRGDVYTEPITYTATASLP